VAGDKLLAEWFWVDRWMGSSGFLLPIEPRGLYREMLTQAWRRHARLPNNHESIRRAVGCTLEEWNRCWPAVSHYWREDGLFLVNDTQLEIYQETKDLSAKRSEAGRLGNQKRWSQDTSQNDRNVIANVIAKPSPPSPSPSPSPISVSDSKREKKAPSGASLSPAALPQRKTNGTPAKDPFLDPIVTERAGRFVERYGELYASKRNGARYASKIHRDYAAAVTLCQTWPDDERLDKLAICFLTTDHKFAEEGSRTIPQFLALASWCDGKLAEWEKDKQKRSAS